MNAITSLLVLAAAAVSFSSCVVSDYPGGPATGSVSTTFGIYDTLPNTYVGDAYYYRNRYYYGGNYETGRYMYQGSPYTNRYYHNGQYYYGGRNEYHGNTTLKPARYENKSFYRDERDNNHLENHDHR